MSLSASRRKKPYGRARSGFAKAFKISPHPILISEMETGRLVEVNDAASRLLCHHTEERENQIVSELEVLGSAEEQVRFRERMREVGPLRNLEVSLRASNGDIRRFLPVVGGYELNGKPCRVTVGDDVTDRKRAEDELRRSHGCCGRSSMAHRILSLPKIAKGGLRWPTKRC